MDKVLGKGSGVSVLHCMPSSSGVIVVLLGISIAPSSLLYCAVWLLRVDRLAWLL